MRAAEAPTVPSLSSTISIDGGGRMDYMYQHPIARLLTGSKMGHYGPEGTVLPTEHGRTPPIPCDTTVIHEGAAARALCAGGVPASSGFAI